ncbi:hypothetical protein ACF0H5_012851 [Mactra antiquata]
MAYSMPVSLTILLCFGLVYCQSVIEFPDAVNDDTDINLKNEIQSLGEDDNTINYFKDEDLSVIPLNAVIDVQNANETSYDIFRRRRKSRKRHSSRRHKKRHASRRHSRHKKRHASRRHKSHGRHKKRHHASRRHKSHKKRHHASRRHGRHKKSRHASRRHSRHGRHKKRHHASRRHGRHGRHKKRHHASRRHGRHGRHKKRHHASRRHGRHGRHKKRHHGRHGRHHGRRQKRHHCHQRDHVQCHCGVGECTCTISHDFTSEHGSSESEFCLQASLAIIQKGSGFQTTTASYTTSIGTQQTGGASTSAGGASTSMEAGTTVATTVAPEAAISMKSPILSSVEEDEDYYGELQNAGAMYDISFTANGKEVKQNDVSLDGIQPLCAKSIGYDICLEFYSVNAETGHFCTKLTGTYTEGSQENNLELEVKCMNLSNKDSSQLLGDSFEDSLEE